MSEGPAPICVVLGDELASEVVDEEPMVDEPVEPRLPLLPMVEDAVVLSEGEVVLPLVPCAITGREQARPRETAAATWESFFMDFTPCVSMDP
jgi:hypothetical protein